MLGWRNPVPFPQPGLTCGPSGDQLSWFVCNLPSSSPESPMSQFAQDGWSLWSWSPLDQLQRRLSGLMELCQDSLGGLSNYISFW